MTNGRVKGDLFVGNNVYANGEELATSTALTDGLASKLPYSYGTATPSTSDNGFLWYDSNSTPAATKFWDGSAFVPFGGKILQIVRATDSTDRSTTSTSFVDVGGMSVTITPQKSDSAIIVLIACNAAGPNDAQVMDMAITDSSNNALSGAEALRIGANGASNVNAPVTLVGYSTPATTSAVTYKMRFKIVSTGTGRIRNNISTGQMYAIEVSA